MDVKCVGNSNIVEDATEQGNWRIRTKQEQRELN
jgi:hypothetical protein